MILPAQYLLFYLRAFVESHWCLEEFSQAYHQVVEGRLNHIIVVLLEKPAPHKLPPELETYLTTHCYIDARKYADNMETIRKRVRFAMPKIPRGKLLVRMIFLTNINETDDRTLIHYTWLSHLAKKTKILKDSLM